MPFLCCPHTDAETTWLSGALVGSFPQDLPLRFTGDLVSFVIDSVCLYGGQWVTFKINAINQDTFEKVKVAKKHYFGITGINHDYLGQTLPMTS